MQPSKIKELTLDGFAGSAVLLCLWSHRNYISLPTMKMFVLNFITLIPILWPRLYGSCSRQRLTNVHKMSLCSASHSRVAPENVGLKKNKTAIHLHVIPVMKCGCVFWEFAKRKLVTRKDKIKTIMTKRYGYATFLPLAFSVRCEVRCEVLACFHVVVKMYWYFLEERVFIVKAYWITGSIKNCQRRFVEPFGGWNLPSKGCIQLLVKTFILSYLTFSCYQLPFCKFPKHNRTSLQVWHANVLHFCSFCKPTFSGATREWDALYNDISAAHASHVHWENVCGSLTVPVSSQHRTTDTKVNH
jgi:hypothetical protein